MISLKHLIPWFGCPSYKSKIAILIVLPFFMGGKLSHLSLKEVQILCHRAYQQVSLKNKGLYPFGGKDLLN
jgi:hypothetical protein